MRRRPLLVAVLALCTLAPGAGAAPKPQIVDPKGDYPPPMGDIVSVTFSTVPKGSKEVVQIDMALADAPTTNVPYSYTVRFLVEDCEFVAIYYGHPFEGVFSKSGVGCQTPDNTSPPEGTVTVKGTHVVWTVKMDRKIKRGALLEELAADTAVGGAVSGGISALTGDRASGEEWVVGSDRKKKK